MHMLGDLEVLLSSMPPTVQETLQKQFEEIKSNLLSELDTTRVQLTTQITELQHEKDNSQLAFDKYRERSRQGMLKLGEELKVNEVKMAEKAKELQVRLFI